MLKKLIKYEILSSARVFLPLYAALLTIALINTLLGKLSSGIIFENQSVANFIVFFAFYAICFAIFAVTFVIIIRRFSKNLLGHEGYLMFTLPVSISSHVFAKFLSALIWCLVSSIVVLLSSSLILFSQPYLKDRIIRGFFSFYTFFFEFFDTRGLSIIAAIGQVTLFSFTALSSSILLIYAAISVGHLVKKHKTLTAIVVYIGINTIINNPMQILFSQAFTPNTIAWILLIYAAGYLALSAGYFFCTCWILKNKLNLE